MVLQVHRPDWTGSIPLGSLGLQPTAQFMRLSWTPQNGLGLLLRREVDRNGPVLSIFHDEAVPSSCQVRFRLSYCMTSSCALSGHSCPAILQEISAKTLL